LCSADKKVIEIEADGKIIIKWTQGRWALMVGLDLLESKYDQCLAAANIAMKLGFYKIKRGSWLF
jgi:hypothetical protein